MAHTASPDHDLRRLSAVVTIPFVALLRWTGVSPNIITVCGMLFAVAVGIAFGQGKFHAALLLLVFAGLSDMLDGAYARAIGKASAFGAFLDATLDRVSDIAIYLGISAFYLLRGEGGIALITALAMTTAVVTSYAKARAEAVGVPCTIGWMGRAPRILLVMAGAALGSRWMIIALILTVILGIETVTRRINRVYTASRR